MDQQTELTIEEMEQVVGGASSVDCCDAPAADCAPCVE